MGVYRVQVSEDWGSSLLGYIGVTLNPGDTVGWTGSKRSLKCI